MKKISVAFILALGFLTNSNSVQADELEDLTKGKGEIIYQDSEITVRSFGTDEKIAQAIANDKDTVESSFNNPIQSKQNSSILYSSVTGPGGVSRINPCDTRRCVYWQVKPATVFPYNFNGTVKLRYHSGFKRDAFVFGFGMAGSTTSGIVEMNKNNGGVAYLTGAAYDLRGERYKVLPGVHTSF
ncbi:hypothetical protein KYI13_13015 (plasmid) [Macrococcoides bohemicum]|uniref:hypothetical protein n=1 Tax=Macrococcoides bohemicum TaxID=1903056 RepID=UPI001C5F7204|nr:hypothetical protein [Macrococcus bohemicus]QYA46162.1 hypothetical protein KYI13_13015 [Macrococcus bohemicus]